MNRFSILLLFLCMAVTNTVWAGNISESQAKSIATNFVINHGMRTSGLNLVHKSARLNSASTTEAPAFYVFNNSIKNSGYVIVAGDDRAPAVLGYSDQGTFDPQYIPEAMQELLEGYTAQIESLEQGAKAFMPIKSGIAIRPLVTAVWSQNNPFNIRLPFLPSGKHAYTGCVATAMAQVMYYWKWPARPTREIPAYTSTYQVSPTETLEIDMPELPVIDFNWDAMHDTYQTTDTMSTAALAAATLSLYCAQALEMTFKPSSSGASTSSIPSHAAAYFDYDASAHMESRYKYSTQGWADLLYSELAAGRPVIYSGSKKNSGHSFICDGYDGNGMFHINWGWNGNSNGYFLLNVLNPDLQGTGSASGAYGYIFSQGALVGFQPNKGGNHIFEVTATNVTLNSYVGTRGYTSDGFKVYVSGKFNNYTSDTLDISFGWGLFQDGELIDRLYSAYNHALRPGYLHTHTNRELIFGEGITSGTYRIMPMYTEYGMNNWRPCAGAERNYIEVTINGNQCTASGYGTAGMNDYTINDITMTGHMHNGRPIDIDVNMTNNGQSSNVLLHMFVNGTYAAAGYVGMEPGETEDIHYTYLFENAGNYNLTWSWNEDGSDPIASRTITINQMPAANLSADISVLNVTNANNKIITSDKFSVVLTITNNGTTTYSEDISAKLYKNVYNTSGTNVQGKYQSITLAPGESTTVQFDMDNVIDGWKYFVKVYYYSSGTETSLNSTYAYTIVFPEIPEFVLGDVNNDNSVSILDVTVLIDYLLSPGSVTINMDAANVNNDGIISISDVTALIDMLLGVTY